MKIGIRQQGQAAVETAIVMPLNLFIILGIIQFGLISQARSMAKYAAYRAARVGSMNNADKTKMLAAAQAALLPVMAMPGLTAATGEVIQKASSGVTVGEKALLAKEHNIILPGLNMVDVKICGPIKSDVSNLSQSTLNTVGSSNQVDFDDPRVTDDPAQNYGTGAGLQKFLASKLRVQVQFNYRMPIPFANWILSRAYLGMTMPSVLRMGSGSAIGSVGSKLWAASEAKIYIAPIYENYAIRMQSNFFLRKHQLPTSYSSTGCVHFH